MCFFVLDHYKTLMVMKEKSLFLNVRLQLAVVFMVIAHSGLKLKCLRSLILPENYGVLGIYFIAILLVTPFSPYCQTVPQPQLYTSTTINPNSLNQEQLRRWNILNQDTTYSNLQFIVLSNLRTLTSYTGSLYVPSNRTASGYLEFKVNQVGGQTGEFLWYGNQVDTSNFIFADLYYIDDGTERYGAFTITDEYKEIIDLSGNIHVLATIDTTYEFGVCESHAEDPISTGEVEDFVEPRTDPPCDIRVLFAYLEGVDESIPSINQKANLDLLLANTALVNSEIYAHDARFVKAGIAELTGVMQTDNSPVGDLNRFTDPLEDDAQQIQALRDQFNADVVVVYVPRVYGEGVFPPLFGWRVFGRARLDATNVDEAVAIVAIKSNFRMYATAHEIVHLVGARHQEAQSDYHQFAHAHSMSWGVWPYKVTRRTIVWGNDPKGPFISHYSNPDVEFGNKDTGTSTRNNALQIRTGGCFTSSLDQYNTLTTCITGPNEGTPGQSITLNSNTTGGSTPYSYQWYISTDGVHETLVGTGATLQYTIPMSAPEFIFVRLRVSDFCGIVTNAYLRIHNTNFNIIIPGDETTGEFIDIQPNPIGNWVKVIVNLSKDGPTRIKVVDVAGYEKIVFSEQLEKGIHQIQLDRPDNIPSTQSWIVLEHLGKNVDFRLAHFQ